MEATRGTAPSPAKLCDGRLSNLEGRLYLSMKKSFELLSILLLLPLAASLAGCGAGPDNSPLPKGQVPEWQTKIDKAHGHPNNPNIASGDK